MSKWIKNKKIKALWKLATEQKNFRNFNEFLSHIKKRPIANERYGQGEDYTEGYPSFDEEYGNKVYKLPLYSTNYFPNLKYLTTDLESKEHPFFLYGLVDEFIRLCKEKLTQPRTISYFKKLYKEDKELFLENANNFFNSLEEIHLYEGWKKAGSGSSIDQNKLVLYYDMSSESADKSVMLHEFFHYFDKSFFDLMSASMDSDSDHKEGYIKSIEDVVNANIISLDKITSEKLFSEMYNSPEAEELFNYTKVDKEFPEPTFEITCEPNINDLNKIREEFVEWSSNLFAEKFKNIYSAAWQYATDKNTLSLFDDISPTYIAYATIENILNKQNNHDSLFSNLTRKYVSEFLEGTGRVSPLEFYKEDLEWKFSYYIDENSGNYKEFGFYKYIPERAMNSSKPDIYNLFFSWAMKYSDEYKAGYERCAAAFKADESYKNHMAKKEKELADSAKGRFTDIGSPKKDHYDLGKRTYISVNAKMPSSEDLNKVLQKHYGYSKAREITKNFTLTPEDIEGTSAHKYGDASNIHFFAKRNLEHQAEFDHKGGVAIRTLYWHADKHVKDYKNPDAYERFFLKLLKLEFPDSMYKDTELCRSLLLFMHDPEYNSKALSSYFDLAKLDDSKDSAIV